MTRSESVRATHGVLDLPATLGARVALDELLERVMQRVHRLVRERSILWLGQLTSVQKRIAVE
jgi:hypothetical protein